MTSNLLACRRCRLTSTSNISFFLFLTVCLSISLSVAAIGLSAPGEKDLQKRKVLNLEWKSERVVDYESGDSMEQIKEVPLKELGESEKHSLVMWCMYHHHHFICPIIQQFAHLHDYNFRRAGQQGPIRTLTAALKTFNKNSYLVHILYTNKNITNEKNYRNQSF